MDAFGPLAAHAQRRGFRRYLAAAMALVGCIPAAVLTLLRRPGLEDAPLIGALFVFVPGALLFLWTYRDRDGQAARELTMWLRAMRRASADGDSVVPLDELPEVPEAHELERIPLQDMALEYREVLAPLAAGQGILRIRIAIYRYWYAVAWLVVSTLLVIGFLAFVPR